MTNKQLLMKVKDLISKTQSPEQLYSLLAFTNMYIDRPTKDNIITAINKDLSIYFMASLRLVNCIIFTIKKDI